MGADGGYIRRGDYRQAVRDVRLMEPYPIDGPSPPSDEDKRDEELCWDE